MKRKCFKKYFSVCEESIFMKIKINLKKKTNTEYILKKKTKYECLYGLSPLKIVNVQIN